MFKSYWSYLLYEVVRYKPIMVLVLVNGGLILFGVTFHDNEDCVGFSILFLIFSSLISIYPVTCFWIGVHDQDLEIKLLVEVIAREPAVNGKEWRTITYNMSRYLIDEGRWNTPYYFYCEKSCHLYFLSLIGGRTFKKQENAPTSGVMDTLPREPSTGTSNEDTVSFTFHPGTKLSKAPL